MKIATGIDIVEIQRVKKLVEKYLNDPALERIFHKEEILYCTAKGQLNMQSFAARFAAKEAVAKALGTGFGEKCLWNEIVISNDPDGAPRIELFGATKETFEHQEGMEMSLSVSHCKDYAVAMVVLTKGG